MTRFDQGQPQQLEPSQQHTTIIRSDAAVCVEIAGNLPILDAINHAIDSGKWSRLNDGAKAVYLVLLRHANRAGVCWPGIDRIMHLAGVGRSTTFRAFTALEAQHLLYRYATPKGGVTYIIAVRQETPDRESGPSSGTQSRQRDRSVPPAGPPSPASGTDKAHIEGTKEGSSSKDGAPGSNRQAIGNVEAAAGAADAGADRRTVLGLLLAEGVARAAAADLAGSVTEDQVHQVVQRVDAAIRGGKKIRNRAGYLATALRDPFIDRGKRSGATARASATAAGRGTAVAEPSSRKGRQEKRCPKRDRQEFEQSWAQVYETLKALDPERYEALRKQAIEQMPLLYPADADPLRNQPQHRGLASAMFRLFWESKK